MTERVETPARKWTLGGIASGTLMLVVLVWVNAFGEEAVPPKSETEMAVDEFIAKVEQLHGQRHEAGGSAEDWESQYERLIKSEAERLQTLMPAILQVLAQRLTHRSEREQQIEELLKVKRPTAEQAQKITSLSRNVPSEEKIPRCAIGFVIGHLGRQAPNGAVDMLLGAAPSPERAEDLCLIRALMTLGPDGYKHLVGRMSTEVDPARAYVGVMALVVQARHTEFPNVAGLGEEERWENSFPRSTRALNRLARKWQIWWSKHQTEYEWNPDTALLEAR